MKGRAIVPVLAGLILLASSLASWAQQKQLYGVEEYNAYVDTTRSQNPVERLQFIDTFLKNYPQSVLRAFVYFDQAQVAYAAKRYGKAMEAVNNFLAMDRNQVETVYKPSGFDDRAMELRYYEAYLLFAYSFLQAQGTPEAEAHVAQAASRAQQGLELHQKLYSAFQPPADPAQRKQFEQTKQQQDGALRTVLALAAWRQKDYPTAAREYAVLVDYNPNEPALNYRLGVSYLQPTQPQIGMTEQQVRQIWGEPKQVTQTRYEGLTTDLWCYGELCKALVHFYNGKAKAVQVTGKAPESKVDPERQAKGFWHLARAIKLDIPKKDDVKDFLTKNVAAYQGVYPACSARQVNKLLAAANASALPPAGWQLTTPEQIGAVRQEMTVKRIFDDLKAGGQQEEMIWLAGCGLELPELEAEVLEVGYNEGNVVTLNVAVTQEAADAKQADVVVTVIAPPEAKNIKAGDIIHFTGILNDYQKDPLFQLKLTEGKVKAEDIPKTRGRGGSAR